MKQEVSDTYLLHLQQLSGLQFRWDREHRDIVQPPDLLATLPAAVVLKGMKITGDL